MGKYYNKHTTALAVAARDGSTLYLLPKQWTVVVPELEGSSALVELVKKGILVYRSMVLPVEVLSSPVPTSVPTSVPVVQFETPLVADHVVQATVSASTSVELLVESEEEAAVEEFEVHLEESLASDALIDANSTTEKRPTKSRRR